MAEDQISKRRFIKALKEHMSDRDIELLFKSTYYISDDNKEKFFCEMWDLYSSTSNPMREFADFSRRTQVSLRSPVLPMTEEERLETLQAIGALCEFVKKYQTDQREREQETVVDSIGDVYGKVVRLSDLKNKK